MDIYQIVINQNPQWSGNEIKCFGVLIILILNILFKAYKRDKIRWRQCTAYLLLFIYIWIVLESTVFTRVPQNHPQYELQVFWSWKAVFRYHDRELLKENILNCMLLLPYGCMIPIALGKKISWKKGLLIGMATSAVIEVLQLISYRGLFEFDDIIHNGVGCMIGIVLVSCYYRTR